MMKTVASVHSAGDRQKQIRKSRVQAQRTLVCVMTGYQLLLWVAFFGYDQSGQAVWQSVLMLMVPGAAAYLLWKNSVAALSSKAGRYVPLALILCLLVDAAFLVFSLGGFISQLMPQYPFYVGYAVPCAFAFFTVWLSRAQGVENGAFTLKGLLVILFVFATVFLRASNRADRLWPILGKGILRQLKTALSGAGCLWGAALLFVLPKEKGKKAAKFMIVPWLCGSIWALWHGFVRPWSEGDAIAVAEKLMGLARYAHSVTLYEIAGLMWMAGIPLCLCGCVSISETLVTRAFPRCPRVLAAALFLLLPLAANLFWNEKILMVLETLLPWRMAVSLVCAAALFFIARKEAKG